MTEYPITACDHYLLAKNLAIKFIAMGDPSKKFSLSTMYFD